MCFLVHPAHFTEIQKVCEMLNSESTNILEEEEEEDLISDPDDTYISEFCMASWF